MNLKLTFVVESFSCCFSVNLIISRRKRNYRFVYENLCYYISCTTHSLPHDEKFLSYDFIKHHVCYLFPHKCSSSLALLSTATDVCDFQFYFLIAAETFCTRKSDEHDLQSHLSNHALLSIKTNFHNFYRADTWWWCWRVFIFSRTIVNLSMHSNITFIVERVNKICCHSTSEMSSMILKLKTSCDINAKLGYRFYEICMFYP